MSVPLDGLDLLLLPLLARSRPLDALLLLSFFRSPDPDRLLSSLELLLSLELLRSRPPPPRPPRSPRSRSPRYPPPSPRFGRPSSILILSSLPSYWRPFSSSSASSASLRS